MAMAACSASPPYVTTVGVLRPGTTLRVEAADTTVNAYAPATGQPPNLFTVAATALPHGTPPPPPLIRPTRDGVAVIAPSPLAAVLVRVPERSDFEVLSRRGDVNVTDIGGNARVVAHDGNVTVMLPGYAQVSAGTGSVNVTMGATQWPGTLHFVAHRGDITLWINPKAACAVHLHTDDGTLFSDFGLRGTSNGPAETIDGVLGGGSLQRIDVETGSGAIRLLRLQPQA